MGFGLDSIIASKVKPHLSKFFVDFTDENMSIGLNSFNMRNVQLRPDVLDQFGLPFTVYGTLGELSASLSFDWSLNPYLTVEVKNVFMLVVPSSDVPFDAAADAEKLISGKRKEIVDFFAAEAARLEAEAAGDDGGGGGMLAGFITGLINSIKLNIDNIHVRYEDSVTRPAHPFAGGAILKSLSAESRDPEYNEGSSPTADTFYKLVLLNGLGAYWNSNAAAIANHKDTSPSAIDEASQALQKLVEDDSELNYFVGPLSATAKAMVTLKPERLEEPFSLPKVDASLEIEGVQVGLTNLQYTDLAILGDSMESMNRSRPWRKYRPKERVASGDAARAWWQFAYNCVLVPIRRRREDWSWSRMKEHKKLKLEYRDEYYKLLQEGASPTDEQKEVVQALEDKLDNFSVIIARKEMDAKWKLQSEFVKEKEAGGSWWSKVTVSPEEINEYLADNFSDEQRKKIFDTVHYDPNASGEGGAPAAPPAHARDWVEIKFALRVPHVGLHLRQLEQDAQSGAARTAPKVIELAIEGVDVALSTLPGVSGLKLGAVVKDITAHGDEKRATIVRAIGCSEEGANFLDLKFEKNPLDSNASKRVVVRKAQLEIVYDSRTVQKIVDCLALPPDVHLTELKAAAKNAAKKAAANQAAKLKAAVENNTDAMDLDIQLMAPYVLVPEGGALSPTVNVLVLALGVLDVQCRPRDSGADMTAVTEFPADSATIPPEIAKIAYNQFEIKLSKTQVTLAYPGENLQDILACTFEPGTGIDVASPLVKTGDLLVNFDQCAVPDDPRFPELRATVHLPLVELDLVDARLLQLLRLLTMLPLPKTGAGDGTPPPEPTAEAAVTLDEVDFESIVVEAAPEEIIAGSEDAESAVQMTQIALELRVDKVRLGFSTVTSAPATRAIIDLNIEDFATNFKKRSFGMSADVTLRSISATYPSAAGSEPVYLLSTPAATADTPADFVRVHFYALSADCPAQFARTVRTNLTIDVAFLNVTLHQESLQVLAGVGDAVGRQLAAATRAKAAAAGPTTPVAPAVKAVEASKAPAKAKAKTRKVQGAETQKTYDPEEILMQLTASFGVISLSLVSDARGIMELRLASLAVGFEDRHAKTSIVAELESLEVNNLDVEDGTIYKQIMHLDEFAQLVHAQVLLHKDPPGATPRADTLPQTEVTFIMGSPTIVILGSFLGNILGFVSALTTPAAKRAALEGAKAAGGAAAEAAGAAAKYANDARILLDITLDAPDIIIPRDERSYEALFATLGTLRLKNSLRSHPADEREAVIDEMTIGLSGVKASRVLLSETSRKISAESYLLAPVGLNVELARNLSSSWFTELPKIRVGGSLEPATFAAAADDLTFTITSLMNLVNGIAAKKPDVSAPVPMPASLPEPPVPAVVAGSPAVEVSKGGQKMLLPVKGIQARRIGGVSGESTATKVAAEALLVNLAANFTVFKVEFNMYADAIPLLGQSGVVGRNAGHTLGHMETNGITTSAKMWDNGNLEAKVRVHDLIFDDTRADAPANSIKRFVVRSKGAGAAADDPILAAEFKLTHIDIAAGLKSIAVKLKTTPLEFIVNMQYINLLVQFGARIAAGVPRPKKRVRAVGAAAASIALEEAEELLEAVPGPPSLPPLIDADVNVGGLQLVILENPASQDTNALLLTLDTKLVIATEGRASKGNGSAHIGAHTACYDAVGGHFKPIAQIVEPTILSIARVALNPSAGTEVELELSDLRVHFSAGTLLLVSKCVTALGAAAKSGGGESAPAAAEEPAEEVELDDNSRVWNVLNNDDEGYPYLSPSAPEDGAVTEDLVPALTTEKAPSGLVEFISFKTGAISLSIETGSGVMATPMLLVETHVGMEVRNWSSALSLSGSLDLVVAYNNQSIGVWEYVVETVEVKKDGEFGFEALERKPWELKFNLSKPPAPKPLQINLTAPDMLELTVSKSAMASIMAVASAFGVAATGIGASESDIDSAPFVLKNFTGTALTVNIDDTAFFTVANDQRIVGPPGDIPVAHGATARFGLELGAIGGAVDNRARVFRIAIPAYGFSEAVTVSHEQTRYFELPGQPFGLLVAIETKNGSIHVVLRGAVQVENELSVPVEVYTRAAGADALVGLARPGKFISVPVTASLTGAGAIEGLVFKVEGAPATTTCLTVAKLQEPPNAYDVPETLVAAGAGADGRDFVVQASWTAHEPVLGNTEGVTTLARSFTVRLKTPLVLNNLLTCPLTIVTGAVTTVLEPGKGVNVTHITPGGWKKNEFKFQAKISAFEGRNWTADIAINKYTDLLNDAMFADEKQERYLYFKFERVELGGSAQILNFYAPYWMVNHTGLDLGYRTHSYTFEAAHPAAEPGPRMFAYDYYGTKNTCEMRVTSAGAEGSWGLGVNLDPLGIPVGYICKVGEREYHFTVEVALTGNKLTKCVSITPRFMVTNTCQFPVTLREVDLPDDADSLKLAPDSAVPFWPHGKAGKFTLSVADGAKTAPMHYDRAGDSLLALRGSARGGLRAHVIAKETRSEVIVSEFSRGEVPLLFVNDTYGISLGFAEGAKPEEGAAPAPAPIKLRPGESALHTWSAPEATTGGVVWTPEGAPGTENANAEPGASVTDTELKDGTGEFEYDGRTYKWCSFSNGIQRVLLFTERPEVVAALQQITSERNAPATLELSLLLDGFGLSLVNDREGVDVLYVRAHSTDVVWESRGPKEARFALLDHAFVMILEGGYQRYITGALPRGVPAALEGGVECEYSTFSMTKPEEKKLRRRAYQAGVAVTFKSFPLGLEVGLQISQLQVDAQGPGVADEFKHVFAVVPQKGVAGTDTDAAPPIVIVSFRKERAAPRSAVSLVSGDVILQEFSVAASMGLIDDILAILLPDEGEGPGGGGVPLEETYAADYKAAAVPTEEKRKAHVELAKAENTIQVLESFKIYTLKFYATFTVAGGRPGTNPLKVLVMGLGAILANISKVHFVVDGFQVLRMRMSNEELVSEIVSHYIRGILSNMYLLVLKLDVLGNPFKLITGLGTGLASLLADPVLGAMDGRFIGGVADGVTGLLDGTVGNLTDSLSKITGALGKGLEVLHLRGLSDLVNVLSWGLGGVSKLTHRAEPVVERMRPPRALALEAGAPPRALPPYSHDLNLVGSAERAVRPSYTGVVGKASLGAVLNFWLQGDQLLLLTNAWAVSATVTPDAAGTGTGAAAVNWAHEWKEFSGIALNPEGNAVVFTLASKGWGFGATALPVPASGKGAANWLQEKAAGAKGK